MSLSTAVSNLTAKVTVLHDLVKGQYTKWDNYVKARVDSMSVWNRQTYYVSAENGSDDEGIGSSSSPFKTIMKAIDSVSVGGYVTVILDAGSLNLIDGTINIEGKNIYIVSDADNKAIIRSINHVANATYAGRFLCNKGLSSLVLYHCVLQTSDNASLPTASGSLIYNVCGDLNVSMYKCDIDIKENNFIFGYSGLSAINLAMSQCSVLRESSSRLLLSTYNTTFSFSYYVTTLMGNSVDMADYVGSLKKDANGITINALLSNEI